MNQSLGVMVPAWTEPLPGLPASSSQAEALSLPRDPIGRAPEDGQNKATGQRRMAWAARYRDRAACPLFALLSPHPVASQVLPTHYTLGQCMLRSLGPSLPA